MTFLISSSGVAGRAMKIRSYRRSSMMTSFLPVPGTNPGKIVLSQKNRFTRLLQAALAG
jgi:hypothetical protein